MEPRARHADHGLLADRAGSAGRATGRWTTVARRHGATPAQIALAWVLAQPATIAIPKAVGEDHVRENRAAHDLVLTDEDLAALDAAFPPPKGRAPLEMI